jgi:hypothetical protein
MTKAIAVQCKATPKQTGKQCKRKSHPRWRSLSLPRRKRPPGQSESRHPRRSHELGPRRFDCRSWRSVAAASHPVRRSSSAIRSELERLVDDEGLAAAMVGEIEIPTKHGGYKAGEYIRGLPQLEHRNVIPARTSPPKPLLLVLPNAPYGWPNGKVS